MDALKKAEKAKQGPNSVFGDPPAGPSPGVSTGPTTEWPTLSLDPKPAELAEELGLPPAAAKPVKPFATETPAAPLALDPLPTSAAVPPPTPKLALESAREPEPAPSLRNPPESRGSGMARDAAQVADRMAAKGVFTAKRPGRAGDASRQPFYWVVGLLLLSGIGAAIYVWSELQPATTSMARASSGAASGTINNTQRAAEAAPASRSTAASGPVDTAAAPATAATTTGAMAPAPATAAGPLANPTTASAPPAPIQMPAQAPPAPAVGPQASTPGEPPTTRRARESLSGNSALATDSSAPRRAAPSADAQPAGPGLSARGGTPVASPANLRITRERAAPAVDPAVNAGYAALADGNLEGARENYDRALTADNTSRDALLGLAAVASRSGRNDVAESYYQRVLELHPRDPYAVAQMSSLRSGGDAAVAESRVRALLANEREPAGAAPLHFALGNQMAAQGRWADAQQAYFSAFSAEPDNPDYCYNLAVSLDRLHQPRLAHEHYARAIALAAKRHAGFDLARARVRLEQLAAVAK